MPGSRGSSPPDPVKIAEWESRTFPALRRHRTIAALTLVDDEFPENPLDHLDEARSALRRLNGA